jgi:hypothetical protein
MSPRRPGPDLDNAVTLNRNPSDAHRLPIDPGHALTAYAPPPEDLVALSARVDLPEASDPYASGVPSQDPATKAYSALPTDAPEWMRAARVMSDALESCIRRGNIDYLEQAAIERAWYAWTLGGATPRQVLRVAHVVRRAHDAMRQSARATSEEAARDCAEVLHASLPSVVRQTIPLERALWVVRGMRDEPDPWVAVVEGTAELLGWKDYARVHAAYVISAVIQQG